MPKSPGGFRLAHHLAQVFDPARLAIHVDASVRPQSDASGIIAAILQAAKPIEKDGTGLTFADVTNDATHIRMLRDLLDF